ncbi:hypothetical protein Ddc_00502 [Ditylenchus destructor]|nr:hypothetical protein Ddc_00502 [Ditylenchus destructor]
MNQWISSLLFIPLIWNYCESQLNVPEELINEKNIGGAGVKGRLSQKGLAYVTEFMVNTLIREVTTTEANAEPVDIQTSNGGRLSISHPILAVQSSQPLRIRTSPPSLIAIEIPVASLSVNAKINGNLNGNAINGSLELRPSDPLVHLNVSVINKQGSPNIRVDQCKVSSSNQVISINSDALNASELQGTIDGQPFLNDLICSRIKFIVEDRINVRFGLLSPKISLAYGNESVILDDVVSKMKARRQRRQSLLSSFNMSRADSLFLDYTIISDPFADEVGLEIWSSGEVSLRGRGGTPFGPIDIKLPEIVNEDYMLKMAVTDFVPNSLMYHGHTIGLFNTKIDPSTPHFGPIMRTSCNVGTGLLFCLGDLFPTLRRAHPNHRLSLNFATEKAPVIKFHPQSAGGIKFTLTGRIVILLMDNLNSGVETNVAEMRIDVIAHMKLRLSSTSVRPKISLDSIKLTTLSPGMLLQDELDDAVLLAREVLQRMVNDILQDGIPLPVHPLFKLTKPKVKLMDRALLLQTNIDINAQLMRQLTSADLVKQLS